MSKKKNEAVPLVDQKYMMRILDLKNEHTMHMLKVMGMPVKKTKKVKKGD